MAKYEVNVSVEIEHDEGRPRAPVQGLTVLTDANGECWFECESCGAKTTLHIIPRSP